MYIYYSPLVGGYDYITQGKGQDRRDGNRYEVGVTLVRHDGKNHQRLSASCGPPETRRTSQHYGIDGFKEAHLRVPEAPRTSQHYGIKGFKGAHNCGLIMPRDASLSYSKYKFFHSGPGALLATQSAQARDITAQIGASLSKVSSGK